MAEADGWNTKRVEEIVAAHAHLEGPLLPILHAIQAEYGFVPRDAIPVVAQALNLTRAEVYGVVSFYHDFRDKPAGRHVVRLCRAEACQAMGANAIAAKILAHFKIGWGETSADGKVTVNPVYCLGLCSVAPSALIDGTPHGRVDPPHLIAMAERES
jgi:formate dehydrogenase subunit gamma